MYEVNNTGTKIEITYMTFDEWKAPSCLHGGVSFYDSNHKDTKELKPYYKEIYTVLTITHFFFTGKEIH